MTDRTKLGVITGVLALWAVLVAGFLIFVPGASAAKPSDPDHDVVGTSNGYPSGPHFNLDIHGKKDGFKCPTGPYGASAFIPEYSSDFPGIDTTIEFLATNNKKNSVDELKIIDACSEAFDGDAARIQLPKNGVYSQGFWIFARVLAKPKNRNDEPSSILLTPDPVLRVCNDGESDLDGDGVLDDCPAPDSDLMPPGLITNEGIFAMGEKNLVRLDEGTKGKGKVKATDITGLFTWTGYVCPDTLDIDLDGDIDLDDDVPDLNGNGGKDEEDLAMLLALECEFHDTEWVFNVADFVVEDVDLNNNGAKLLKIRFYPVATTEFTPTTPKIVTEFHDESDGSIIIGRTAAPGVNVHGSAILSAGTGPLPEGTVDFTFYANGTCSGDGSPTGTLVLDGGIAHPSVSQTSLLAGSYSIGAHYNGDDPNEFFTAADSSCKALIIGEPALVISQIRVDGDDLTAVTSVAAGTSVHGAATVTGSAGDATGTVSFTFYTSGDCSVGGIGDLNGVVLVGGVADPSASHLDLTEGEFSFMAHYNGED
jgi:hypothetical protein